MPRAKRQFHNLDAIVRDLVAACSGDDDDYARAVTFVRIIADILDVLEDDDAELPDAAEPSGGGSDAQLDLRLAGDSGQVRGPSTRHDSSRGTPVELATGMDPEVVGPVRARDLAQQALPRPGLPVERTLDGPGDVREVTHAPRTVLS